jgi:hypothetical protein
MGDSSPEKRPLWQRLGRNIDPTEVAAALESLHVGSAAPAPQGNAAHPPEAGASGCTEAFEQNVGAEQDEDERVQVSAGRAHDESPCQIAAPSLSSDIPSAAAQDAAVSDPPSESVQRLPTSEFEQRADIMFIVGASAVEHIESDETSCCYLADGAESQQVDYLGQLLARRVEGKLEIRALDLAALDDKTADAQAAAFRASLHEVAALMEKAGKADARAADLIRKFLPTCSMNDRASTARAAARKALGLDDGDNDPTCAEHGLVNILEEGRKAHCRKAHW